MASILEPTCLFCKIIKGEIPSMKLLESDTLLAFLDIGPLSKGHSLIIPKYHGVTLADIPDEFLVDLLPAAKKIALASGVKDYNILQNNGRIAHQVVDHVHFHVIPKPSEDQGLVIGWPAQEAKKEDLLNTLEEMKGKL